MKTIMLGGFVGGFILFMWGWLAWTVLPLHTSSFRSLENEDPLIEALRTSIPQKGVYGFPGMPVASGGTAEQDQKEAMDAWEAKYQRGPVGLIIYDPQGSSPMMPAQMVVGFIISVLSASLASWLLSRSTAVAASFISRVAFCGILGIFLSVGTHLLNWNWMNYPLDYTTSLVADAVLGWLLAGLGIAAIVKANNGTSQPA